MCTRNIWIYWTYLTSIVIVRCENLSANKYASQYIEDIASPPHNYDAKNAVDGKLETCMRTKDFGITSTITYFTWWYVDLGDIYNVHNIRIQFKQYDSSASRQMGRFAGFSLYVSNTTDRHDGYLCYKNGPKLPFLDFITNCLTIGRFVIFYNERLKDAIYPDNYQTSSVVTELCEVTVTGCSFGVYGENCKKPCPDNCQGSRCDIINGTCSGCTPGWLGARCDKTCSVGYYGLQCKSSCIGNCKDSTTCNHISGLCDNGCDYGWTGTNCNKECPLGSYGPYCVYNCSGNCLGDVACNRTTGKCDTGCDIGYTGNLCDKACEIEKLGKGCSNRCSGHCVENFPCNSTTGHCDRGCASGYVEPFCNKSCDIGKYGIGCSHKCSGHCLNNVPCNSTNGHCDRGCASGYVEPFCNKV